MSSEADVLGLLQRVGGLSYYQVLGLPHRYATPAEVKQAFHAFAQLYHPDLYRESDDAQAAAKEVFKRAVEAYEVLRDAMLQRRYVEAFLKKGHLRLPPTEFSRRASLVAAAAQPAPQAPPAPRRPSAPLQPRTWVDEMKTEDGREVAARIDRLLAEGRWQAANQQIALLQSIEGDTPPVRAKVELIKRRLEQSR